MPEASAALARSRFRSTSILRCAATLPAVARVVPSEEMNADGVGCRLDRELGHWLESDSTWDRNDGEAVGRFSARRDRACTGVTEGVVSRRCRIAVPWKIDMLVLAIESEAQLGGVVSISGREIDKNE